MGRQRRTLILISRSHLTSSKIYWIIAVSGRQIVPLTAVIVKYISETVSGEVIPSDVEGDRRVKLEDYCNWGLTQVNSDRWRNALQFANEVAIDQFLELITILKHPKVVADLMVKLKVSPGIALQFVSNVEKFMREEKES
jgi:hypothetical protein